MAITFSIRQLIVFDLVIYLPSICHFILVCDWLHDLIVLYWKDWPVMSSSLSCKVSPGLVGWSEITHYVVVVDEINKCNQLLILMMTYTSLIDHYIMRTCHGHNEIGKLRMSIFSAKMILPIGWLPFILWNRLLEYGTVFQHRSMQPKTLLLVLGFIIIWYNFAKL